MFCVKYELIVNRTECIRLALVGLCSECGKKNQDCAVNNKEALERIELQKKSPVCD